MKSREAPMLNSTGCRERSDLTRYNADAPSGIVGTSDRFALFIMSTLSEAVTDFQVCVPSPI